MKQTSCCIEQLLSIRLPILFAMLPICSPLHAKSISMTTAPVLGRVPVASDVYFVPPEAMCVQANKLNVANLIIRGTTAHANLKLCYNFTDPDNDNEFDSSFELAYAIGETVTILNQPTQVFTASLPVGSKLQGCIVPRTNPDTTSPSRGVKVCSEFVDTRASIILKRDPETGIRLWSDDQVASSCLKYRHPDLGREYKGDTGDGVYKIKDQDGTIDVYCDMTTDGGGWTLVAFNNGYQSAPSTYVQRDFFVKRVSYGIGSAIHKKDETATSASIGVDSFSIANSTTGAMLKSSWFSSTPIIDNETGIWDYNTIRCDGILRHTSKTGGCSSLDGNNVVNDEANPKSHDNSSNNDMYNIAFNSGNEGIVPNFAHNWKSPQLLCWSHSKSKGAACRFEFYLR